MVIERTSNELVGPRIGYDEIFRGIQLLDYHALNQLAEEINRLVSQRKTKSPASREAELLRKIKAVIPASIRQREKQLYARMQAGTISPPEKRELDMLLDMMEQLAAERIMLMGELAQLRGIPIQQLAAELKPKSAHA